MRTILLLAASNIFMTFAWYYHLKHEGWPLWKAILISWCIALIEYCLAVPANRLGHTNGFTLFQLKIIQEVITLIVFAVFAVLVMKEAFHWRYLVSLPSLSGRLILCLPKDLAESLSISAFTNPILVFPILSFVFDDG